MKSSINKHNLNFQLAFQNAKKSLLLFIFIGAFGASFFAQEVAPSPIPVELVVGNHRFGLQAIMNKPLPNTKKWTFFSVSYVESHKINDFSDVDFVSISQVAYRLFKGFSLSAGMHVNRVHGLSPSAGFQYSFVNSKWLFVFMPNFIFTKEKNIEVFSLVEYKPQITEKLKLYSRIQVLYNQTLSSNTHDRSYLQLRLGLDYKKFQAGFATNFDFYGSDRIFKDNFGVFLRTSL